MFNPQIKAIVNHKSIKTPKNEKNNIYHVPYSHRLYGM